MKIERESIEEALENDRCGICGSVDHFREDCVARDLIADVLIPFMPPMHPRTRRLLALEAADAVLPVVSEHKEQDR